MNIDIVQTINGLRDLLEGRLQADIQSLTDRPQMQKIVEYAVLPGGKRIRPLLALALAQDFGGSPASVVAPAAAIELFHAASLIHDDLPALDNDDIRRGKPSTHRAFGEAAAVLAGDFLIAWSLERAVSVSIPMARVSLVFEKLARAFGDVCYGQQLDLLPLGRVNLPNLHRLKTGALFGVASYIGASALDEQQFAALATPAESFGVELGIYFQLVDDYLDIWGEASEKGRPAGSDQRNQRATLFDDHDGARALSVLEAHRDDVFEKLQQLERGSGCACQVTRALIAQLYPVEQAPDA